MRKALRLGLATISLAMVLGTAPAFAAQAKGGVEKSGSCTAASTWKLKASPDNGRIEVGFEVDSNIVGQKWSVTLKDNGSTVWSGTATTKAPSGSFEVNKVISDKAGSDKIQGTASNAATGETCKGTVTL
jgi:hypothetical protein